MTFYFRNLKISLLVFLGFIACSCNSKQQTTSSALSKTDSTATNSRLLAVKPQNISLKYTFIKNYNNTVDSIFKIYDKSKRIKFIITNNNEFPVYLVHWSCDDLPGPLKVVPDEFEEWQFEYCNASWPIITQLDKHKSVEFSSNLRAKGKSKIESLGMYVLFVDRAGSYDTLGGGFPQLIESLPVDTIGETWSLLMAEKK